MARKFHVNDEGNIGRCTASEGRCRFGSEDEHSSSPKEARRKAEEKLTAEYSTVGSPVSKKRPIDHLTNLLFAEMPNRPRDMKKPMPDSFRINSQREKASGFDEFVKKTTEASNESRPEREMSQAAWNVNRDRIFNREIPVVDDNFKSFYTDARIENSNLTLQGWEPKNSTQDYVVKDLVENTLAQHSLRLEIDGIREDPFHKAYSAKNEVTNLGTDGGNKQLQTVSEFSNGWVYGIIDATERAKTHDFKEVSTDAERKQQLKDFVRSEATLTEMTYQSDNSEFNDGRASFFKEWIDEQ